MFFLEKFLRGDTRFVLVWSKYIFDWLDDETLDFVACTK